MSISFKGAHFPKDIILHAVFCLTTLQRFLRNRPVKPLRWFSASISLQA